MPTSHWKQISHICEALTALQPDSLLEIGFGMGKYGVLAREYLDVWGRYFEPWGSHHTRIEGIEVHDLYLTDIARAAYDRIHLGDARVLLPTLGDYHTILLVDVLEHFTLAEGTVLLAECLRHAPHVLIGMPYLFAPTVEVWGNPHEIHRAGGEQYDFTALCPHAVTHYHGDFVVAILHREVQR